MVRLDWSGVDANTLHSASQGMHDSQTFAVSDLTEVVFVEDLDLGFSMSIQHARIITGRVAHGLRAEVRLEERRVALDVELSTLERPVEAVTLAMKFRTGEHFVVHHPRIHRAALRHDGISVPPDGACLMASVPVGSETLEFWCRVTPLGLLAPIFCLPDLSDPDSMTSDAVSPRAPRGVEREDRSARTPGFAFL